MADDFGLGFDNDLGGFGFPRKRRRKIDKFSPEDEATLLGTLGNKALSGISMAGNVLDVPGSMVRDVIAGENPFDQLLTPHTDVNRKTGRDLLRMGGLISNEDTYGNWWGGLGAEILLDPTTYLSGGLSALTKGGKAFKAAGLLDDAAKVGLKAGRKVGPRLSRMTTTVKQGYDLLDDAGRTLFDDYAKKNSLDLASIGDEPIQTLGRASLPFTDIGFNFGSGKASQFVAGTMDYLGEAAKASALGRGYRALFDHTVNGKLGKADQEIAEEAYKAKWKAERKVKAEHINLLNQMDETFKAFNETMGPEIAARNQASWDGFKTKLATEGNLTPEKAEAISEVWKGYAEGYLKSDPGEAIQRIISDVQKGGEIDPKALKQESQYKFQQFYSKFARVADQKLGNKFSWDQFKATMKNNGVKDEELRDLGLEAAFGGKKGITKQEVAQHYLENAVKVEEKVLDNPEKIAIDSAIDWLKKKGVSSDPANEYGFSNPDDYVRLAMEHGAEDFDWTVRDAAARFQGYQVPGGEPNSYREFLIKLPDNIPGFDDGHFSEKGVIAHARVDDVMLPDGRKALRIQEIQSDWHQRGAKHGYIGDVPPFKETPSGKLVNDHAILEPLPNGKWVREFRGTSLRQVFDSKEAAIADVTKTLKEHPSHSMVPDGPFKDSWQDLALKNILKHAAEEGYEAVVMVHGEDIAKAVGGPSNELGTFYNEILTNKLKKTVGKYGGKVTAAAEDAERAALRGKVADAEKLYRESSMEFDYARGEYDTAINTAGQAAGIIPLRNEVLDGVVLAYRDLQSRVTTLDQAKRELATLAGKNSLALEDWVLQGVLDRSITPLTAATYAATVTEDNLLDVAKKAGNDLTPLKSRVQELEAAAVDAAQIADDLSGSLDNASSPYRSVFEITPKLRESILNEGQPLYQKAGADVKGATTFADDGKALLQFFGAADVSTHLHEMSHVMRRHLTDADNEIANKFVGAVEGKKWTRDQEEKWARGFENYMRTGKAPSSAIKALFDRLKDWMVGIYKSITGSDIDVKLTPEVKELYGRLIGTAPAPRNVGNSITYETMDKLIRLTGETGGNVEEAWKLLSNGGADLTPEVAAKVKAVADSIQKLNIDVHSSIESKGGKANWIVERMADEGVTSGFAHMPRFVNPFQPKTASDLNAAKQLRTSHAGMLGRSEAIRAVPAEVVNRMLSEDTFRGDDAATEITNRFGKYLDPEYKVDDKIVGKEGHAKALAQWIGEHRQAPLFTRGTAEDFLKYQMGAQVVDRNLDAIHEIVRRNMDPAETTGPTIKEAFARAGMNADAVKHWAKLTGLPERLAEMRRIPADVAEAIASTNRIFEQPEWAKAIGEWIDRVHMTWKSAMTVPWPAFHSRNFSSGQYMNMATGLMETPADLAAYSGEVANAIKMLTSTGIPKEIQEELYTSGVLGKYTRAEDIGINAINANQLPGKPPALSLNPMAAIDLFKTTGANLPASRADAIPGVRFGRTLIDTPTQMGSKVAENVEFLNRVPLYNYLRKKGWSAEAAVAKIDELHVDYSQLSPFEKNVMRRLVPFYTFQRKIAPAILQTVLERPGGALAQTIKASADLNNADPLTPEHVASTLAIPNPLKGDDFAGKSYITGLGLPHEQLLQFAGGPRTVLREAVSQTSPLVKAPLEWATGQSFFQSGPGGKGRDLEELDPTIGRTLGNLSGGGKVPTPTALEFVIANSPLSRAASTARTATDSRKNWGETAINLLTGAKVTDVSPENQERIVQQRAMDLMKEMGARTFEKPYFPDELEAEMTPEEAQQADALELLQAVLADRQKKRKKAK